MDLFGSYPHFPHAPSEDVILGTREGRNLSPVRRFYCLLVTFDLLFTILLWILCIILIKGSDQILDFLMVEVQQYTLKMSLFDIVMCAASRFTILLLFYAFLQWDHWFPVAFTTAGSCAFLLAKVFLFDWKENGGGSPWPVLLVLSSFVLSWSEAWFLDFRVVPIERQARIFMSRIAPVLGGPAGVGPWIEAGRQSMGVPSVRGFQSYPQSEANFYSPLESPEHSDKENEPSETESNEKRHQRLKRVSNMTEVQMWLQQGPIIAQELIAKIQSTGWVLEKTTNNGDNVLSKKSHRKIFMVTGLLPVPPAVVAVELFNNFESVPTWNAAVTRCEIIQKLDDVTDISYQISKEGAGGAVSPRDFVTLRHHKIEENGCHILAWVSVKHASKPKQPKIIRGRNEIGGWYLASSPVQPNSTEFQWILDVDLQIQGWVPKRIVDSAVITAALDTVQCLRSKLTFCLTGLEILIEPENNLSINECTLSGNTSPTRIRSNPEETFININTISNPSNDPSAV